MLRVKSKIALKIRIWPMRTISHYLNLSRKNPMLKARTKVVN